MIPGIQVSPGIKDDLRVWIELKQLGNETRRRSISKRNAMTDECIKVFPRNIVFTIFSTIPNTDEANWSVNVLDTMRILPICVLTTSFAPIGTMLANDGLLRTKCPNPLRRSS